MKSVKIYTTNMTFYCINCNHIVDLGDFMRFYNGEEDAYLFDINKDSFVQVRKDLIESIIVSYPEDETVTLMERKKI